MFETAQLIGGLVLLTAGAELLVRNAAALAAVLQVSPLVIGLTVVAFGTSAPEFVVSLMSSLRGQPDLAMGNVIGSNIFNVLFILGISAMIVPLRVAQQLIHWDVPLMIALSGLTWWMAADGTIGRANGCFLVLCLVAYTVWGILQSRREQQSVQAEYQAEFGAPTMQPAFNLIMYALLLLLGLSLLIIGSRWFTDGAASIARWAGVSELVIGLTIVAAGTSLPEVATSVLAAIRGERDIAVGNVVGSNLFNLMGVLGTASVVAPKGIAVSPMALSFDLPVMVIVAFACLPVFVTGHTIARWEGALFFVYFCAYMLYLVMATTLPQWVNTYEVLILGFAAPLTAITMIISLTRWWHRRD